MSRKKAWEKAIRIHGRVKIYTYIAFLPVIIPLYCLAYVLMFIGAIGERIERLLSNI